MSIISRWHFELMPGTEAAARRITLRHVHISALVVTHNHLPLSVQYFRRVNILLLHSFGALGAYFWQTSVCATQLYSLCEACFALQAWLRPVMKLAGAVYTR